MVQIANEDFKTMLESGVFYVTFRKVNGQVRTIRGTCDTKYLPENKIPEGYDQTSDPEQVCTIYDLDIGDWRSFRWNRVITVQPVM